MSNSSRNSNKNSVEMVVLSSKVGSSPIHYSALDHILVEFHYRFQKVKHPPPLKIEPDNNLTISNMTGTQTPTGAISVLLSTMHPSEIRLNIYAALIMCKFYFMI